jgi:uncharacterized protein DUF4326
VTPQRIQLSRRKGWRMPVNTVRVARPGRWGNPFIVGKHGDAAKCVDMYRNYLAECLAETHPSPELTREAIAELRGKNLACWCALGQPCHADVLLELANK